MDANQDRMTTMNIALPEAIRRFVESRAAQRNSSVSEYLLELVRQDERRAVAEKAEASLLHGLGDEKFDRTAVKEAIEGIRRVRGEVTSRGATMSREEIRSSINKGRR
ncbi:MAG TPA: hypothetical protein VFT55_04000 [Planctomycetota bacterium]|nr:hypothetical protein [Planctomycetota bacterium]